MVTLQYLDVGLLVQAQHHLTSRGQPLGLLVTPENPRGLMTEGVVWSRCLSVPGTMRLQGGIPRDDGHGGVGNGGGDAL
jgi:hypothetical protein